MERTWKIKKSRCRESRGERVFHAVNYTVVALMILLFVLPFWLILSASFSSNDSLLAYGQQLWPSEWSVEGYEYIFVTQGLLIRSILNSVYLAAMTTVLSLIVCVLVAYPLSRKQLPFRGFFSTFFIFTMMFGGGLIPSFLLINSLGLYDTLWALIIPGLVNAWHIMLLRNYFTGIPDSLEESAKIDGANDFLVLFVIYLPLSKSIIATVCLFTAVGQWNNWFGPMVYLKASSRDLYPIQYLLREMLFNITAVFGATGAGSAADIPTEAVQNAAIIVTIAPIVIVYPFVQEYFINGVIIGSVKG